MRWAIGLALGLALAACGQKPVQSENQASASEKVSAPATSSNSSAAEAGKTNSATNAQVATHPAGVLPSANAAVRYAGTWATSPANCKSKPWRFAKDSLHAKDGPQCSFYNVAKVPGGYDVAAQCPTKTPIHTDLIKLRFAESAGAMLVESNAIAPTGLVYCGK